MFYIDLIRLDCVDQYRIKGFKFKFIERFFYLKRRKRNEERNEILLTYKNPHVAVRVIILYPQKIGISGPETGIGIRIGKNQTTLVRNYVTKRNRIGLFYTSQKNGFLF